MLPAQSLREGTVDTKNEQHRIADVDLFPAPDENVPPQYIRLLKFTLVQPKTHLRLALPEPHFAFNHYYFSRTHALSHLSSLIDP